MIDLSPEKKLVITGAGGWLGTELLEKLLAEFGSENLKQSVICLGSKKRILTLSDQTEIPVSLLSEELNIDSVNGFVHLSFLTRDKVADLGTPLYSFTNLSITARAIELIEQLKPSWIATVSSGAVLSSPQGSLENNLLQNPYGFTKRIEETMLQQVATQIGSHLAIGRLWGAMGEFMPVNRAYAVSDFICQTLQDQKISIRSGHNVWRRYCDAGEFMDLLTTVAQNKVFSSFDSGGELVEVGALAQQIAALSINSVKISRPQSTGIEDRYFPDSEKFESLANEFNISLIGLQELLAKTYNAHEQRHAINTSQ